MLILNSYWTNELILPAVVTAITIIIIIILNEYKLRGISDHISYTTTDNKDSQTTHNHTNIISDKNELSPGGDFNKPLVNNTSPIYQISSGCLIAQNPLPPGCRLVKDPGKALAQMVRFKLRFHRKVVRFREKRQQPKACPTS